MMMMMMMMMMFFFFLFSFCILQKHLFVLFFLACIHSVLFFFVCELYVLLAIRR